MPQLPPSIRTVCNVLGWILVVVAIIGLLATIVSIFFVRGREDENPMNMLNRGYWVTTILSAAALLLWRHAESDRAVLDVDASTVPQFAQRLIQFVGTPPPTPSSGSAIPAGSLVSSSLDRQSFREHHQQNAQASPIISSAMVSSYPSRPVATNGKRISFLI